MQKFRRAEFLKFADELMTYPIAERKMNKDGEPVDIFEDEPVSIETEEEDA